MSFRPRMTFFRQPSILNPQPIFASVVKLQSSSASNGEFAGGSPAGCTNLRACYARCVEAALETATSLRSSSYCSASHISPPCSRGHEIMEGMHPQYDLFKQWTSVKRPVLETMLGSQFILYGV